eukprot:XP_001706699.1 Hypothetical protein GL50803_37692 [Giardia lamblia ATCC 50803]
MMYCDSSESAAKLETTEAGLSSVTTVVICALQKGQALMEATMHE